MTWSETRTRASVKDKIPYYSDFHLPMLTQLLSARLNMDGAGDHGNIQTNDAYAQPECEKMATFDLEAFSRET